MDFSTKQCSPCQGGVPSMNRDEAIKAMQSLHSDWELLDNATWLQRDYECKDFKSALEFVNKVGRVAEQENHHPDIYFTWGQCSIRVQTHKIGGLHENDFILAAKIDTLGNIR